MLQRSFTSYCQMQTVLATPDGRTIFLAQPEVTNEQQGAGTGQDGSTDGDQNAETPSIFGGWFLPVILGMMVLWIFLLGGGSRKQKKKQQEMLAAMSKGSKIVTIGGIKGSVVEVRDDEVVVKVDENNNTRMKFTKDAIRTVLEDGADKESK